MNSASLAVPKRDIFAEAKERYTIHDLWLAFGFPCKPEGSVKSPFRDDDKDPSFSIYDNGRKFKDHGTGQSGDVIEFARLALGSDYEGVRDFFRERLGIDHLDYFPVSQKKGIPKSEPPQKIDWPRGIKCGGDLDWERFSRSRGLSNRTLWVLGMAGIVIPCTLNGQNSYVITDKANRAAEIRRIDGGLFGKSKAYPLSGVDKSWPVGMELLRSSDTRVGVLLLEGATDLISAIDLYTRYRRDHKGQQLWVPAALLGASCRKLHPEAATLIQGRYVRIVPDADAAGEAMAKHWADLLRRLGCTVDVVRLPDGTDLTDHLTTILPPNLYNR